MENKNYKYCNNINQYGRFVSREVLIGNIPLGGENPIRIQSMTNTNTLDTEASIQQCIKIFDAGADYVRLTTQTTRHANNLSEIKSGLIEKGYKKPLIADIHFNPKVAEVAAQLVEKVRVNPGNFVERKNAKDIETEEEYQQGLDKIDEQFTKLINICKEHKTAIRIGCNHGSLSPRIVNKYGDTVEGMAQSVMEFLRIARKNNFHEIVISLKASNTRVMVYAYRLLMNKMIAEDMNYPLHLGVTEAGDGEDGRIKSAVGIGSLLVDGIGDTIRVSLTEAPEEEIPVARKIVNHFTNLSGHEPINAIDELKKNPFEYSKRKSLQAGIIGAENKAVVVADLSDNISIVDTDITKLGYKLNSNGKWIPADMSPDFIFIGKAVISVSCDKGLKFIANEGELTEKQDCYPWFENIAEFKDKSAIDTISFISVSNSLGIIKELIGLKNKKNIILLLESNNLNIVADQRAFMQQLYNNDLEFPVIVKNRYNISDFEDFQIKSACDIGPLLIDGYLDGIMISNPEIKNCMNIVNTSFTILQASRTRMSKTEYISCPSCGRTLFEIQNVTEKIKKRTGHLKGLKIAVMGCIVNGPGEMADADYGYVGAGAGKVSLYKGKEVIKKNIASEQALDDLIELIKNEGDWKEP